MDKFKNIVIDFFSVIWVSAIWMTAAMEVKKGVRKTWNMLNLLQKG